ncbi:MAG TPA: hypothetical protein PKK12_11260 [Candidatus Aminicenantes bacterium]|nr:hypothetical protein [Candidatus Aminicenantes bacterium]
MIPPSPLPASSAPPVQSFWSSVLVGAALAGVMSILPLLNLLNLFFLFWMVVGAAVGVKHLYRTNPDLSRSTAVLAGAFSGLLGSLFFAVVSLASLFSVPTEQIEESMNRIAPFFPGAGDEILPMLQSSSFRVIVGVMMVFFVLASTTAGAVGGLIGRRIFSPPPPDRD